ncbi:MAG: lactate utilization protein [Thermodesulfobacteriota bacterium]|nr:lactate utilization protein [Thermodesulfobacteriota bacterium]
MENPIENYWRIRLKDLKGNLEGNNFQVFIAQDIVEARTVVEKKIFPAIKPKSVSWGGSMTFTATGLYDILKNDPHLKVIDPYDKSISSEEILERRRQSLLVDLFLAGTNAVTQAGQLVNLDMIGNRVAGIAFGPKNVIVFIGRNKIVPDLESAMFRIKNHAAPINTMRLGKKTPCAQTSYCEECRSPNRICNTWTITEKSFPKGRIKVVLINQELGL